MFRILIPVLELLVLSGAVISASSFISSLTSSTYEYVRFRERVLTLRRKGLIRTEEVSFVSSSSFEGPPGSDDEKLYTFPGGTEIPKGSHLHNEIQRCLRFAINTNLLQTELETEVD